MDLGKAQIGSALTVTGGEIEMTKQEAIEAIRMAIAQVEWEYPMDYAAAFDMALKALNEPEIILCKDCEHATMTADGKMCKYCAMDTDDFGNQRDVYHDADWFCADGIRKK